MSLNRNSHLPKVLLLLAALWPLSILVALAFTRFAIAELFEGEGEFLIPSLNLLMVALVLWAFSPLVAAVIARQSGLLTTRGRSAGRFFGRSRRRLLSLECVTGTHWQISESADQLQVAAAAAGDRPAASDLAHRERKAWSASARGTGRSGEREFRWADATSVCQKQLSPARWS
jgi:hypothetical protein